MGASGPGITDIKLLFARSGNQCAFPKCQTPMALGETLIGEVCHIKGSKFGSARYDSTQSDAERHAYDNLVLVCPTHHTVIDDDAEAYTVEHLRKIKTAHEARSSTVLEGEASRIASLFVQSNTSVGQTGGLSAQTVHAATINVQAAQSTNFASQRQIQAVERLWQVVRSMNSEFSFVVFVDTILLAEELDAHFRGEANQAVAECIREYEDMHVALRKFTSSGAEDAAAERPFVSSRLWSVFSTLRGIYGRTALLLTNSYKHRRLVDWRTDTGCDQLLRMALPEMAVARAKALKIGGLRAAIDYLETQFLAEAGMNKSQA